MAKNTMIAVTAFVSMHTFVGDRMKQRREDASGGREMSRRCYILISVTEERGRRRYGAMYLYRVSVSCWEPLTLLGLDEDGEYKRVICCML